MHHNTFTNMARGDMPGAIDVEPNSGWDIGADILVECNTITRSALFGTGARYGILATMFSCVGRNVVFRNNNISGMGLSAGCLVLGTNGGTFNTSAISITANSIHDGGWAGVELDYGIKADITNNEFVNLNTAILNYLATLGDISGNLYTNVIKQLG